MSGIFHASREAGLPRPATPLIPVVRLASVRYLLTVVSVAVMIVGAVLMWDYRTSLAVVERPRLLAIAAPESVFAGERVSLYGGIWVPAGRFELGIYACQDGSCSRSLWRGVEGPGEAWGGFGAVQFDQVGPPAAVELRLFEVESRAEKVVATWRRSVAVLPSGSEADQHAGPPLARGAAP